MIIRYACIDPGCGFAGDRSAYADHLRSRHLDNREDMSPDEAVERLLGPDDFPHHHHTD